MNMAASFAPARPVAQHCGELIRRGPRPEERAEHLSAWRRDVEQELAQELGALFSGGKLHAALSEPDMLTGAQVFEKIGPVAVNSLLRCGEGGQTVLLSLDYATALALTDCSFGGEGLVPEDKPEQLPRSASLLIEQVAGTIAQVLASVQSPQNVRGDVLVRSESVTRLKPFGAGAQVASFALSLAVGPFAEWTALLAVPNDRLEALLPGLSGQGKPIGRAACAPDEGAAAFAAMPLSLEAVLGEVDLPLARLETLEPGDELPLAIARELPLRIGEDVFAHGALGTQDNRMALSLTRFVQSGTSSANHHEGHQP